MSIEADKLFTTNLAISTATTRALIRKGVLTKEEVLTELTEMMSDLRNKDTFINEAAGDAVAAIQNMPEPDA